MGVRVRFFASIRERLGRGELSLQLPEGRPGGHPLPTVREIYRLATGSDLPRNTLAAINLQHAGPDQTVSDGDEVAFFPPVTGG